MVSAALRVTETPGSCRIHSDEYDVNEDAGGEDDSEDMVSTALRVTGTVAGTGTILCDKYNVNEEDVNDFDGSEDGSVYDGNAKNDDEYLGRGERRRKKGSM